MTSSFIICTKDRLLDLQDCLKSIVQQTILPDEVIIIDASEDNISAENQKNSKDILSDKIKLIFIRSKPSTTRQRNIGIDHANGDIVFFLDDDVILEPDYHAKMLEVYELKKEENIGGVRGSFSNYESMKGKWCEKIFRKFFFMRDDLINGRSRILPSLSPISILMPDRVIEVEYMPTCICSYYKKVLDKFRFDESLDRYALAEDWDLSYRVSRRYKLYQTPYACLFHKGSPISRVKEREFRRLLIRNSYYIAKKHIPKGDMKWLAYYWSVAGYVIFTFIRGIRNFNFNELIGVLDGIKGIIKNK